RSLQHPASPSPAPSGQPADGVNHGPILTAIEQLRLRSTGKQPGPGDLRSGAATPGTATKVSPEATPERGTLFSALRSPTSPCLAGPQVWGTLFCQPSATLGRKQHSDWNSSSDGGLWVG